MSDFTPPKFWKTQGHANYWLGEFIRETTGQLKYHDLFRLPPLVFDKVRDGWRTKIVLKKRFVDDPDALEELIRYERMPWQMREEHPELCGYWEENYDED